MERDIRWKRRFQNFENALKQLQKGIEYFKTNPVDLVKEGIIQRFKFTHELAWKVMKDFLEYEGLHGIMGSRSATREAFNKGIISDGQIWMDMITSRNNTVHTYNPEILETEFSKIVISYATLFASFHSKNESIPVMFGLPENTVQKINAVFSRHPEVEQVIIYGSRAKGNYREGSDIDITLKEKKFLMLLYLRSFRKLMTLTRRTCSIFPFSKNSNLIPFLNILTEWDKYFTPETKRVNIRFKFKNKTSGSSKRRRFVFCSDF